MVREDFGAAGYAEQEGQTKMQEGGQITGQEQMVLGQGKLAITYNSFVFIL